MRRTRDPGARFWEKVAKTDGCWLWTAAHVPAGYGYFFLDGRHQYAHRVSYEWHQGPIPMGYSVLHHCDNPSCIRPTHLFLGTNKDNIEDSLAKGRRSGRYQCKNGHPYTPENIGIKGSGYRFCRTCLRLSNERRWREANPEGRGKKALRTHCPVGHPYSPENTVTYNGMRKCRTCRMICNRAASTARTLARG